MLEYIWTSGEKRQCEDEGSESISARDILIEKGKSCILTAGERFHITEIHFIFFLSVFSLHVLGYGCLLARRRESSSFFLSWVVAYRG